MRNDKPVAILSLAPLSCICADITNQSQHSISGLPVGLQNLLTSVPASTTIDGLACGKKQLCPCFLAQPLHGTDGHGQEAHVPSQSLGPCLSFSSHFQSVPVSRRSSLQVTKTPNSSLNKKRTLLAHISEKCSESVGLRHSWIQDLT